MYPTNEDGQIVGMQPLDEGLEEKIHSDVATIAAAFTCTGSCHNQSLGGRSCAFRIQEAAVIDNATMAAESPRSARSAREAMAMEAGEGDDGEWRTVLYSIDEQKAELEAHVAEPVLMHGVKALLVKAEENEPEFNKEPEPKAETHAYLKFCLEGKCTPEAVENMETCSPKFVEAIGSILRITRPLSFS